MTDKQINHAALMVALLCCAVILVCVFWLIWSPDWIVTKIAFSAIVVFIVACIVLGVTEE